MWEKGFLRDGLNGLPYGIADAFVAQSLASALFPLQLNKLKGRKISE
jgi:hypothetical protein